MSGKRFYSPATAGLGYSQLYRSSSSRPRVSAGGGGDQRGDARMRPSSLSPHSSARAGRSNGARARPDGQRYVSPSYLRGSVSPGGEARASRGTGALFGQTGPPRGDISPMSTAVTSPADVHHMLTDLVEISEAIATYISQQDSTLRLDGGSQATQKQQAMLKAQEIERIVKRVESHFLAKMNALQAANQSLERQVEVLQAKLAGRGGGPAFTGARVATSDAVVPEVREGLRQQEAALDQLDKAWDSLRGDNEQIDQLRRILVAEKRQRLLVEEQTQLLTEQHAKVVSTLERRLRKQEDQLHDLINALDRNGHASAASPPGSVSGSPEKSASAVRGVTTPRHLLRQQLAQHQQTQRALQEYQEQLTHAKIPFDMTDEADELGLSEVQRTLDAIEVSQPLTLGHNPMTTAAAADAVRAADSTPVLQQRNRQPQLTHDGAHNDVDEISAFLDNITKELETISGGD